MNDLDRWAHECGYSDFDTFVRAGGSVLDAASDIRRRIQALEAALKALRGRQTEPTDDLSDLIFPPAQTPTDVLHEWQADALQPTDDEPPDPENAQIQGAEHP